MEIFNFIKFKFLHDQRTMNKLKDMGQAEKHLNVYKDDLHI